MAGTVADVMTRDAHTIEADQPIAEAARQMRSADTGAMVVTDNGRVVGVVTDRDITVRVVAENKDPSTPVREACSADELTTVGPDTSLDQAVQLMRTRAIRRLPVLERDRVVGILSIGDLAMELDETSALADISAAGGNS